MNRPVSAAARYRGLTQRRLSRRAALRFGGLSGAAMALAACGVEGQGSSSPTTPTIDGVKAFWAGKSRNGELNWANWSGYMDPQHPELEAFKEEFSTEYAYDETITEMGPWLAKIQPQLAARQSIGYDLMVITSSMEFMILAQSDFLAPLDHDRLPNVAANMSAAYQNTNYDQGNFYSVPYASGITGIAYDPEKVDRVTSILDLWNRDYAGKVGMMTDPQELANFGLLAAGVAPAQSGRDEWERAAGKLREQKDQGIVRKYYQDDSLDALANGEVWMTMAWSGDLWQLNNSADRNFEFVVPEEGATVWTDSFCIPVTAENPVDALECIDFFYRPDIAASLDEYIGYISPVDGVKELIEKDLADARHDGDDETAQWLEALLAVPTAFPDAATFAKLHYYVPITTATRQDFMNIFEPIVLS